MEDGLKECYYRLRSKILDLAHKNTCHSSDKKVAWLEGTWLVRAGPEEALINWSGQEVGMALDNLWVWPMTIHGCSQVIYTFIQKSYFIFLYITKIV